MTSHLSPSPTADYHRCRRVNQPVCSTAQFYRIYDIIVLLELDEVKSVRNLTERGNGFERFADIDFDTAVSIRVISLGGATSARNGLMRKNASKPDAKNPEWTAEEMRAARPLLEVLPNEVVEAIRRYRGQRGPQKTPTKEMISLRVDRDVVAAYRATGPGWQARANEALRACAPKTGSKTRSRKARRGASRTVTGKRPEQ